MAFAVAIYAVVGLMNRATSSAKREQRMDPATGDRRPASVAMAKRRGRDSMARMNRSGIRGLPAEGPSGG
jgi:hypothetical protein